MPIPPELIKVTCSASNIKVPMKPNFFFILFQRAFKVMKNGVYFIVITLLVAELFKILTYANWMTCDIAWTQSGVKPQKIEYLSGHFVYN